MFRPRVIPCLLLKDKGLVKTTEFKSPIYVGDPINAVRIFNESEADELVFLDVEASKEGRLIFLDFVKKVGEEAFMPFAVGGGIRTIEEIRSVLSEGAEKVVINTKAVENPSFIHEASEIFGNQSIIVSIDVKKQDNNYEIFTHSGTKSTSLNPVDFAKLMEEQGAGEILINSIDKDGTMKGYDLDLIKRVSQEVKIPVIACGGAGVLNDFLQAASAGASAVAAGSMFVFFGSEKGILINYPDKEELIESFQGYR